jgi:hypothetical protein
MKQLPKSLRISLQAIGWVCFFAAILTPPLLGKGPPMALSIWAVNCGVSLLGATAYFVTKTIVLRQGDPVRVFQTFAGFVYALLINGLFLGVLAYLWVFERA